LNPIRQPQSVSRRPWPGHDRIQGIPDRVRTKRQAVGQGQVITLLTFPGVMVHELAHMVCCLVTGTRVLKVRLFRLGNPAGYVMHEHPSGAWKTILIGTGPFFVNTLAGFLIAVSASLLRDGGTTTAVAVHVALIWLAVSVAMHSFPSVGDARGIWGTVRDRTCPIMVKMAAIPIAGFIYLGALGSMFWLDLVYAVGVTIGVPAALGVRLW
jgi:hypothetical protein